VNGHDEPTTATLDEVQVLRDRVAELEHAHRERRLIEESLIESKARQKAILDNILDIAWLKDRDFRYVAANRAFTRLCGMSTDELVGKTDYDLWPPELAEKYRQDDLEVMRTGVVRRIEEPLQDLQGRITRVETIKTPVRNDRGEIIGTTGIARDVTERVQSEEALHQRIEALTQPPGETSSLGIEDLFKLEDIQAISDAFAEATGVASLITDLDGQPITKPSNFCRLCLELVRRTEQGRLNCMHSDAQLGEMRPDGPVVQPCLSAGLWGGGTSICAGDRRIAKWLVGQVLDEFQDDEQLLRYADRIGVDVEEYRAALGEVTRMPLSRFRRVCDALGLIANQLSTLALRNVQQAREIAARQQAERELDCYKNHLEELVEHRTHELAKSKENLLRAERLAALGTLAGGIAHEINNPVGGILLLAQYALSRRTEPEDMVDALEKIVGCAQRCKLIVQNVLSFARAQTSSKAPADLNVVVRQACEAVAAYAADNHCRLSIHLDAGLEPLAMSTTGIEQVTTNLLRNAIQAGARCIDVRTDGAPGGVRLTVANDGARIAPGQIPRLFDPFFTTRHGEGGTGLGLSIAHGIAADHGGTIEVTSDAERGTAFAVFLPRQAGSMDQGGG